MKRNTKKTLVAAAVLFVLFSGSVLLCAFSKVEVRRYKSPDGQYDCVITRYRYESFVLRGFGQGSDYSCSLTIQWMKMEFHGGFDHFGFQIADANQQWEMTWYTEQGHHLLLTIDKDNSSSKPDGAANGSQPIRSETNSTSSAVGSRR